MTTDNALAWMVPFPPGTTPMENSVVQPLLVPLGVPETRTHSGKTGITTTALCMAPTSVVPAPTAILLTKNLAKLLEVVLFPPALFMLHAVIMHAMWFLVMVSLTASRPPALQSLFVCDQSDHCADPAELQVFFHAAAESQKSLVSDDPTWAPCWDDFHSPP